MHNYVASYVRLRQLLFYDKRQTARAIDGNSKQPTVRKLIIHFTFRAIFVQMKQYKIQGYS